MYSCKCGAMREKGIHNNKKMYIIFVFECAHPFLFGDGAIRFTSFCFQNYEEMSSVEFHTISTKVFAWKQEHSDCVCRCSFVRCQFENL